ncbi:MAG: hypothetical protein K1X56_11485 [Flavobacteriales bacterium]|nr:hypothetical protein [Flavobacteriales bacterium]
MRNTALLVLIILLGACVKKRDLQENTAIIHIAANPNGLHITNDISGFRAFIFEYIHKPIIRTDIRSLNMAPVLCEGPPAEDESGTRFTYRLKPNIRWDDGSALQVEDVIFTIKVILSPFTNNPQIKGNFTGVIKSIEAVPGDSLSFVMITHSPNRGSREVLTEAYLMQKSFRDPKGVLDNYSFADCFNTAYQPSAELTKWFEEFNAPEKAKDPKYINGLGPYRLTEWVDDAYIVLEKKKNWWGDKDTSILLQNEPDKIIFRIIKDETATYFALRNENIDAINRVGLSKLIKLQQHDYFNEAYYSEFVDQYAYNYIGLNTKPDGLNHKSIFTDKQVRKAIAHLVPVDDLITVMYKGKAGRQVSFVSSLKKEYNTEIPLVDYNPEKAAAILDAAGWKDTDGNNIRDKVVNGEKLQLSFKLNYMSDATPSREIVLMIKDAMAGTGVEVVPNPLEFSLFYEKAFTHDFDAMMGSWQGSALYEDPVQLWHTSQWANFGANFCGFGNAYSDSLIEACNREMNDSLYLVKIKKLQALIADEQPYVFLFSPKARVAIHRRFEAGIYSEKPQMYVNAFRLVNHNGNAQKNAELK